MDKQQLERYNRQIILPQIGEKGQQKLLNARVLVVGAGGLGAPVLQYLVAAGVGTIGIMDADVVSLSNLQRQVLYREHETGLLKVEKARETLQLLNHDVTIETYPFLLTEKNANQIIINYDMIIGATDNFSSRQCIDKATKTMHMPFIHGSIGEFEGQVSVFNYHNGPSYSDLFGEFPDESSSPLGVLGLLPGIIGSIMASEVVKIIIQKGTVLSGKLLVFDALNLDIRILELPQTAG